MCKKILKWANPGRFLFILVPFQTQIVQKSVGFSRIRIRIVIVEGKHANHLTTTTALVYHFFTYLDP